MTKVQPRALRRVPLRAALAVAVGSMGAVLGPDALAAIACEREVTANVVAMDQPVLFNRLGASNVNGMMFALATDVVNKTSGQTLHANPAGALPGQVQLRPDKRPRPLVLRVRRGDCLTVNLRNLLSPNPNPNNNLVAQGTQFNVLIDEQVADRHVSFHAQGLEYVNGPNQDDGAFVGANADTTVAQGAMRSYKLYAPKEGAFSMRGLATTVGSDANQGNSSNLLFGEVIVEPAGARIYRGNVAEEDLRLATVATTPGGQPVLDYEARYPNAEPWLSEGKAGLPVLNMIDSGAGGHEIVHTAIDAAILGPNADGSFPPSTYPLESQGLRNPSVPNRLQAFRDFASIFHDEPATAQAFPGFYKTDPVFRYVLAGVKDGFMINYGSGGIGTEILANRLRVGPMHDCLSCAFEEFFLTSFTVGDPAQLVDIPANTGLEGLLPGQVPAPGAQGPKATMVPYPADPANVHHSYTGDLVKFRNIHVGKEQHVFHLHNHQWLYNANDDNSNYLDAQGIGPGAGYTYEIAFGGSGNRNKTAGDAIFHCHFYPHFAQGMWYMWRNHDVLETGTLLEVSGSPTGFHTVPYALENGTPMLAADAGLTPLAPGARVRALPDGEVVAGAPIPAVVPLPGKAIPVAAAEVQLVANPLTTTASMFHGTNPGGVVPVGSLAKVVERDLNPGYPFWIAGIEDTVGQRPPTPPLDMLSAAQAAALASSGDPLWGDIDPAQADGFDGGLPRATLNGYAAGGHSLEVTTAIDFSKVIEESQAVFYPEEGTDVERAAMAFHAVRKHPSFKQDLAGNVVAADFVMNGNLPAVGAPYNEPCIDDTGVRLNDGVVGSFFSGESLDAMSVTGRSVFSAEAPRIYKGSNIQFDVVLNKVGYHYPQQRIITLWQDAVPVITKAQPPEPLVMRLNTFDCAVYHHTNLVPEVYETDDYQVRTPTDIIGQHIHLPKWDLTTADGAANGWNYEDGTLSPGAVRERIHAINVYTQNGGVHLAGTGAVGVTPPQTLEARPHPFFSTVAPAALAEHWVGARTTTQRWFADPVVNTEGVDRGLGIIFTHDHYGPSTHQQIGLYATVLTEPAGSAWVHNETGAQLGYDPATGTPAPGRFDGGPTSWQAAILPPASAPAGTNVATETLEPFREFYFEYSDFQHAYEPGVYVGTDQLGAPLPGTGPGLAPVAQNTGNAQFNGNVADAFRFAINPPARAQINPVFPDIVLEVAGGVLARCPARPCPQAIDVEDPGMFAVNYRNEPVGLRVYDPNKQGPDGRPGTQAAGLKGDLAFALQSRTDRAIGRMNVQPQAGDQINGTVFPPPINAAGVGPGDPFTPMVRTFAGDLVRVKMQAGGHEEEHNATIHGLKWLQTGSGHGKGPNSGWRNAQAGGISEQFTLTSPVVPVEGNTRQNFIDYAYSMDASHDGWWSGMWGILRSYETDRNDLVKLPTSVVPLTLANGDQFQGVCPIDAPVRQYDVSAVLANEVLPGNANVAIQDVAPGGHEGIAPSAAGGTLVYNARNTVVSGTIVDDDTGQTVTVTHQGPLHDPTAMLYVHTGDLEPAPGNLLQRLACRSGGATNPLCPVKLKAGVPVEPVVLRAAAGDCIQVTLRNRLPAQARDLATLSTVQGSVKRDRFRVEGATTFQTNLVTPSGYAGLHPQLVAYDVSRANGILVGENQAGFLNPLSGVTPPRLGVEVVRWYAGDLEATKVGSTYVLDATPVEFGAANLQPADVLEQGAKSLVGALVVEPQGATWDDVADDLTGRQSATVTRADGSRFRDFSAVFSKALTHYYADTSPVEHMNGEGVGMPEDSQEASGMAINYGIEPIWFRHGILPQSPFGNAGTPSSYGAIPNQFETYSNGLVGGDPETPVFLANAGQEMRMRVTNPFGTSRGTTFQLHGHVWQRDPYVCAGSKDGLAGRCATGEVGSTMIGDNPLGFAQGGQESITPATHFDVVLPSAGGGNAAPGDYLFRDSASFGNASGLWGIVRVQ